MVHGEGCRCTREYTSCTLQFCGVRCPPTHRRFAGQQHLVREDKCRHSQTAPPNTLHGLLGKKGGYRLRLTLQNARVRSLGSTTGHGAQSKHGHQRASLPSGLSHRAGWAGWAGGTLKVGPHSPLSGPGQPPLLWGFPHPVHCLPGATPFTMHCPLISDSVSILQGHGKPFGSGLCIFLYLRQELTAGFIGVC